jgi:hypothetical protein
VNNNNFLRNRIYLGIRYNYIQIYNINNEYRTGPLPSRREKIYKKNCYLPIRTLSVSTLELILIVRLVVRCVTGFNKDCPHILSARLWQFQKKGLIVPIRTQMGALNLEMDLKSGKGEG